MHDELKHAIFPSTEALKTIADDLHLSYANPLQLLKLLASPATCKQDGWKMQMIRVQACANDECR